MSEVLHASSSDLASLANIGDFISAVEDGYRQRGNGALAVPSTKMSSDRGEGIMKIYFAILPESAVMGGSIGGFGSEGVWAMIPLFDSDSGSPLAVLDGIGMNMYKTGATGAVAVDHLARPDARSVGVIGSGPQAMGQLRSTVELRPIDQVKVYSPTREHRIEYADTMESETGIDVTPVDSSAAAVEDADIVITATNAESPVIDGDDIREGTHINAVGRYHPKKREIDTTALARATYVPDLVDRAFQDAGAFLQARREGLVDEEHIHGELGDIVAGTKPGRESSDEITLFDSGGTGIETVASAYMLYTRALEEGIGSRFDFASYQSLHGDSSPLGGW